MQQIALKKFSKLYLEPTCMNCVPPLSLALGIQLDAPRPPVVDGIARP